MGCVKSSYKIFVGKPERKSLGGIKHRGKDIIRMNLAEIMWSVQSIGIEF
jgi:hypothetical protein